MGDVHHISLSAFSARENNPAAPDRLHLRPNWRAIIRSQVRANDLQNWMKARLAEMRSNRRGKFKRGTQKGLLQGFAVGRVVGGSAEFVTEK
jgi:hypothetical protein